MLGEWHVLVCDPSGVLPLRMQACVVCTHAVGRQSCRCLCASHLMLLHLLCGRQAISWWLDAMGSASRLVRAFPSCSFVQYGGQIERNSLFLLDYCSHKSKPSDRNIFACVFACVTVLLFCSCMMLCHWNLICRSDVLQNLQGL